MTYEGRENFGMHRPHASDTPKRDTLKRPRFQLMGACTLIRNDIVDQADEDIGEVREIILDMRSGRVAYAILSYDGVLSVRTKLFAVPWKALRFDAKNQRIVLNIAKERLENAPSFDKDDWPNMADPSWAREIHSHYGTSPSSNKARIYI